MSSTADIIPDDFCLDTFGTSLKTLVRAREATFTRVRPIMQLVTPVLRVISLLIEKLPKVNNPCSSLCKRLREISSEDKWTIST